MLSLLNFRAQIDEELRKFFNSKIEGRNGVERDVLETLKEFTMRGGKRIRPVFMLMGYSLNDKISDEVIKASISLEIMQSYMLIHDDIIDRSDLRRGRPTVHKVFNYDQRTNEGLAIIAADLANTYCHEVLMEAKFPLELSRNAFLEMEKAYELTGIGQLNDMVLPFLSGISLDDVTRVHRLKTAEYTVNGPMKIGASLSGYNALSSIESYGIPLGIAFQIQDDILGVFGDEQTLGKSVKSDVQEGKMTHLVVFSLQKGSKSEREFLKKMLGNKDIADEEFGRFKDIIRDSGALNESEKLMQLYYNQAISAIPNLTRDEDNREELRILAEKMVSRVR